MTRSSPAERRGGEWMLRLQEPSSSSEVVGKLKPPERMWRFLVNMFKIGYGSDLSQS